MISRLLSRYRWVILIAMLASGISALSGLMLIKIINESVSSNDTVITKQLMYFGGALMLLFTLGFTAQQLLSRLSANFVAGLRKDMVSRILRTPYQTLENLGGNKIYATITTDISNLSLALIMLPEYGYHSLTIIFCLSYLAYLSISHFLLMISFIIVAVGVSFLMSSMAMKHYSKVRNLEDDMFKDFNALIDGSKELSLSAARRNHFYNQVVTPTIDEIRKNEIKSQTFWNLSTNWGNTLIFLSIGSVVFSSMLFLPINNTVLLTYVFTMLYVAGPIGAVIHTWPHIGKGLISIKKVESLELEVVPEEKDPVAKPEHNWNAIELRNINFQYDVKDDNYAFSVGPINMEVKQGELLFIIGGNGSGKSTFSKILTGLYSQTSGELYFNNLEITKDNIEWYKSHFSTIFSDFYLFRHVLDSQGSIANDDTATHFLRKLRLDHKVSVADGELSNIDLSQGQKKRLALLMTYLADSPIYLFDEWAADQDPHFRDFFYTELLPEMKAQNKTVIVISHDDKYFSLADRLIEFDNGQPYLRDAKQINFQFKPEKVADLV